MTLQDPTAHACFTRIRALVARRGEWDELVGIALEPVARFCANYLRTAREIAALSDDAEPGDLIELRAGLAEQRRQARESLVVWGVLDDEFADTLPALNEAGEDPTIAALCASGNRE